jgi:hypothetical protein
MALRKPGDGSFVEELGADLGTQEVTVSPGTQRPERDAAVFTGVVQAQTAFFNVGSAIFEGDRLAWDDPRGGRRHVYAIQVKVNDAGGEMAEMSHLAVKFDDRPPAYSQPKVEHGGHVIIVNGNNVNLAVEGSTITQQVSVTAGYRGLADAIEQSLVLIERTEGLDSEEVEAARDAAAQVLEEATKTKPDDSVIKKLLPTLKGVLMSAASGAAGAAASALVTQLFIH